ncbi:LegC family aminotransferase [[Clostridium] colinum]|uniref:LegC family aminotransferase n=1 Tax=[Clostridium] colinum TaxID=36835 RepID=UPI002024B4D2|nr:LegC family aminotransferase [[Clostridium] colinum]
MNKFIPLSVPNIKGKEIEYVIKALEAEWVSTAGSFITEFENNIIKYTKCKYAAACQSGTAGIHLALLALDVKKDDEVIVPTLTFIAAVNPVKYIGATPIFMDCDDSLCLDVEKLEEFCENECIFKDGKLINKLTNKHIKAIIAVHIFGNMCNMEKIMKLAKKYNLKVIEDATESLGTFYIKGVYKGSYSGTIGDVGIYSFNGNKIITTGGGGMVVSNNLKIINKIKYLSTQAKDDEVYFVHNEIGYNYRMTNVQAAIGLGQLENLEKFIKVKQENYNLYNKNSIKLLKFNESCRVNYWFYSYLTDKRDILIKELEKNKIQSRPIWKLIHTLIPYKNCQCYKIEKANYYYDKIVNIPCSSNLSYEEVLYVCSKIKEIENN